MKHIKTGKERTKEDLSALRKTVSKSLKTSSPTVMRHFVPTAKSSTVLPVLYSA